MQFYSKILSNLSTLLEPLYRLTKKNIHWEWDKRTKSRSCVLKILLNNKTECYKMTLKSVCEVKTQHLSKVFTLFSAMYVICNSPEMDQNCQSAL